MQWILEGYINEQLQGLQRIELHTFPATVGRDANLAVALLRNEISRNHAEFFVRDQLLYLRDLKSTNGTFVNHKPLKGEIALKHGDIIHFANCELRLMQLDYAVQSDNSAMTQFNSMPLSHDLPVGLHELQQLLDEGAVSVEYQAIVDTQGKLFAFEALGRGARDGLPVQPMKLFHIAESVSGQAIKLSSLFRRKSAQIAMLHGLEQPLFLNTHPEELKDVEKLLADIIALKQEFFTLHLVLEIHEDAMTDLAKMKDFAERLQKAGIGLAFDDFGAGQARLMELSEIAVDYVKFDIALIRNLHLAAESKRKMVAALAAMLKAMGVKVLAEGVEHEQELALCKQMQFDFIQGYYFAKPQASLHYTPEH